MNRYRVEVTHERTREKLLVDFLDHGEAWAFTDGVNEEPGNRMSATLDHTPMAVYSSVMGAERMLDSWARTVDRS